MRTREMKVYEVTIKKDDWVTYRYVLLGYSIQEITHNLGQILNSDCKIISIKLKGEIER